ncbi:pseudouridine synthase [Vibrio tarriae]|uniref:Pseudouridine synthase n=1 Tax=Vibrio tarriae TaxID=2014742 RepID=A0AAU8WJJ7_9VIBR|nr:DUF1904 domain-containing protein [Vibrio tarriae]ASK56079.1 pseudouridine synthase [Vibrio tarriae]
MPHLRFRAVEAHIVETLVTPLLNELSSLLCTSRSAFTFELVNTQYFAEGEVYPMVEVLWFGREQQTQDQVAQVITEQMRQLLGADAHVAIVFIPLQRTAYYLDGQHF